MQNKRMIIGMAVLMALSLMWNPMFNWLAKKYNWKTDEDRRAALNASNSAPPPTTSASSPSANPVTSNAGGGTSMSAATTQPAVVGGDRVKTEIGWSSYDPDAKASEFPVGVKLTSRGAGIEAVNLNRYKRIESVKESYVFQNPYSESSPYAVPLATRSVSISETTGQKSTQTANLWDADWKLTAPTTGPSTGAQSSATFEVQVPDSKGNRIEITKSYTVHSSTVKDPGPGYQMTITYTFKNPTTQPIKVKTAYNGPTVPLAENNRDTTNVVMGYDAAGSVAFWPEATTSFKGESSALDLKAQNPHSPLWAGFSSNYFDAIVRPVDANDKPLGFDNAQIKGFALNPDAKDPTLRDAVIAMETPELEVPPNNGTASFKLEVYVGPKLRAIIKESRYSKWPAGYDSTLVIGGFCGRCVADWMIDGLVGLLNLLHTAFQDWGLAIIGLVIIVRLALHPITKRSQVSMSKMTKLGPEMERLKKKYGDDKEGLQKAQLQLTKEQGIAPILGCLPMFLQMPIWIALWSSLQSTFEIRHAPFLWGHTWIKDLAQPDRLVSLKEPIGFWFISFSALNVLPILMGVIFFLQQKFMPQATAMTPEQAQQQKMMKWMMPFMMPVFLYSSPSGLNLYILTSTAIGIFESKRVRDHIKQQEEKEKAGLVIIDVPPDKNSKSSGNPPAPVKKGFLAGLMERAQQMAEEAQKNAKSQQMQANKNKKKK